MQQERLITREIANAGNAGQIVDEVIDAARTVSSNVAPKSPSPQIGVETYETWAEKIDRQLIQFASNDDDEWKENLTSRTKVRMQNFWKF